jgi:hypothetical protein
MHKPLTVASVLIFVPWIPARAQSPPQPTAQVAAPTPAPVVWVATKVDQPTQVVWGPGPIGSSLAWIGQKMTGLNRRHVWTIQHTRYTRLRQPAVYCTTGAAAAVATPQHHVFLPTPTASSDEAPPAPIIEPAPIVLPDPGLARIQARE